MQTVPASYAGNTAQSQPSPAEKKRVFVQQLFTRIAPRYDWFNRLASFGLDQRWRKTTIRRVLLAPGLRILDVCAGTGDLAMLCALAQPQASVVGIDMNRAMLRHALWKQQAKGLAIQWMQGDAEKLPFATASFNRVLIGFSTRNLSDLNQGLSEMVRVLKPGGVLLILETGYPRNAILRLCYQGFLFTVARTIGWALTGNCWPFTYLAKSVKQFLTPAQMIDRLQSAGTKVEYLPLSYGLASLYLAVKKA